MCVYLVPFEDGSRFHAPYGQCRWVKKQFQKSVGNYRLKGKGKSVWVSDLRGFSLKGQAQKNGFRLLRI